MSDDRRDLAKTKDLQIEALRRAKAQDFPRAGALDVVVEGKDEWLYAVHQQPGIARLLLDALDERDRRQSQAGARIEITIRDPSLGEHLRPS